MAKSSTPEPPKAALARAGKSATSYTHPDQQFAMRPDIGTEGKFRKKKAPATYRYDSSLSPALDWDGQNFAREPGGWLLPRNEQAASAAGAACVPDLSTVHAGQAVGLP